MSGAFLYVYVLFLLLHSTLDLRTRPPPTGVKIAKIGKRRFRGQKLSFPSAPEMGALTNVLTQSTHFWGTGKWEFF